MNVGTHARRLRSCLFALLVLASAAAQAQLFRAYLASDGSDANPCTLQQPCRLLPAALAAIASGGEIWMLDSANYNTAQVDVTKSATIIAVPGAIGSVVATGGGHAFSIDTAGVRVALHNLVITAIPGAGAIDGVNVGASATGAKVRVESCLIYGIPTSRPIAVLGNAKVHVVDTIIRDNFNGIIASNGTTTISRSQLIGNNVGVFADPSEGSTAVVHVDNTVASQNNYGFVTYATATRISKMYVTRSVASANIFSGFQAQTNGAPANTLLEVSNSLSAGNGGYGFANDAGTFHSAGNNRANGNANGPTFGPILVTASY